MPSICFASGGPAFPPVPADVDLENKASLQRGAKYFVNYCMGCHGLQYMTYSRMAADLGLTEDQVMDNLMFSDSKFNDYMKISMQPTQSAAWFGTPPPDLSVITRSRGVDWLNTYLLSFYVDESRPFGVNNMVFPDVGMPHVFWNLEGLKKAVFEKVEDEHGYKREQFVKFEKVSEGSLSEVEYKQAVRDLVSFLAYAGEPAQLERKQLGVWVLLFLTVLLVLSYALKKEYWKDVH